MFIKLLSVMPKFQGEKTKIPEIGQIKSTLMKTHMNFFLILYALYIADGSVNWHDLGGRHTGNIYPQMHIPFEPVFQFLGIQSTHMQNDVSARFFYGSIVCNSKGLEITEVSIKRQLVQLIVEYHQYNRILHAIRKNEETLHV